MELWHIYQKEAFFNLISHLALSISFFGIFFTLVLQDLQLLLIPHLPSRSQHHSWRRKEKRNLCKNIKERKRVYQKAKDKVENKLENGKNKYLRRFRCRAINHSRVSLADS